MKKLFSTIKKVALTIGLLVSGYVVGNAVTETPKAETSNNIKNSINEIESGERNVFSQYFTITSLDDEGANVVNKYNPNDNYYVSKQEFNLDFATLEIGEPIVVTFDHDTTINAVRDYSNVHQYKIYEGKEWHYDIDESLYVLGVSDRNEFDVVVLERSKYKKGDIVNVTFKNDTHDSIDNVKKVGYFNE